MKKRLASLLLILCMFLYFIPSIAAAAESRLFAVPSKTDFVMNGKPVYIMHSYK